MPVIVSDFIVACANYRTVWHMYKLPYEYTRCRAIVGWVIVAGEGTELAR